MLLLTVALVALAPAATFTVGDASSLLSLLAAANVTDPSTAEALCRGDLSTVHANASREAFALAGSSTTPVPPAAGCYFFCELGKRTGLIPVIMSEIPWNGMCFSSDGKHVVNRFGPSGRACPRIGWKEVRGTCAAEQSWADPSAEAIVSNFNLILKPMRHELRDAGRASGFERLKGTWLGAYYMTGLHLMDFALLPVQC